MTGPRKIERRTRPTIRLYSGDHSHKAIITHDLSTHPLDSDKPPRPVRLPKGKVVVLYAAGPKKAGRGQLMTAEGDGKSVMAVLRRAGYLMP